MNTLRGQLRPLCYTDYTSVKGKVQSMITATPTNVGQKTNGSNEHTRFTYAHGELENQLGYDLLHMSSDVRKNGLPKEGIYTVDVVGQEGTFWAFVWVPELWSEKVCLVVRTDDVEGMEYARHHFTTRKSI